MKKLFLLVLTCMTMTNLSLDTPAETGATPPTAKKIAKKDAVHGETRVDDYFWMREKNNPDVLAHLKAENAYTEAVMKPYEGLRETLYTEMLGRIKQTDLSVPYRIGEYFYYSRTEEGKQYPIFCRKRGGDGKEEITLNQNDMAKDQKFFALGAYSVSDDANLLAFSTDVTGYRLYTLQFKDLRTGNILPDRIERVTGVVWAADNKTVFYVKEDAAKRPYQLYRHVLGETKDELVYEEKDELFRLGIGRSRDRKMMFIGSGSSNTSEYRYIPSAAPTAAPKLILARETEHEYDVDHYEDRFYIRTNQGARNFRIVSAPVADPDKKNWKEFIPHRAETTVEGIDFFKHHAVVYEQSDALPKMLVIDMRDGKRHYVEFPEPVYSAFASNNPEYDTSVFRMSYQSFVTPSSVFDYDLETRKRTLLKQQDVLGGYDPKDYVSERVQATAADGTKVPVSLVYKKGTKRDGKSPLLLYAYGSYGITIPVTFSSSRLSLLDRGVTYALAHIRGGGDMGRGWYDDGKMQKKMNTFTDFIAAAEHLVKEKYTSSDRLAIQGGSAGGLLMGAVTNLRPDLFAAVVAQVPFVDVLNTMLDPTLPLTIQEYLEWGNPNVKAEYEYIRRYCPYTNIAAKNYPAMLVEVSLNDSQVPYWEGAKYVAKLRATKTDKNVLLLKANLDAGHGGASGRYDALKEQAFTYAFVLSRIAK